MNKLAAILLCVNFITVLFPQPGYIHPDEFFQSSEVVAGDVLGVSHFRVWEFNSSAPVRSIVFPYVLTAPSLYLLRWLNSTSHHGTQISAVKVVMASRLPIAFLSVIGYLATGRLADVFGVDKYLSTALYCSSYVSWTYYTRTFSNSIESVILAVLLLLILPKSLISSGAKLLSPPAPITAEESSKVKEGESKDENIKPNSKKKEAPKDKPDLPSAKCNIKKVSESSSGKGGERTTSTQEERSGKNLKPLDKSIQSCAKVSTPGRFTSIFIGFVIVAGFFNRPTFLGFAFIPFLFWLWTINQMSSKENRISSVVSNIFFVTIGVVVATVFFVLVDTLYYSPQFGHLLLHCLHSLLNNFSTNTIATSFELLKENLKVTPWNFISYNMNSANLAEHGLHPRFLHFLVNLPLLLGPLYIPFVISCVTLLYQLLRRSQEDNRPFSSAWMVLMAIIPVLILSIFPHQEPRFLIPVLPILIVLGAKIVTVMVPGKMSFLAIWTFFNIILTLVYGYMHQAAIIPALSIYQQKLSSSLSKPDISHYHTIFYKTYPPPHHLLLFPPSDPHIHIHDLAGGPESVLLNTIENVRSDCTKKPRRTCQVFVFLPSTVSPRVLDLLTQYKVSITSICPHLSMEAPPRVKAWWRNRLSFDEMLMDFCLNVLKIYQ